MVANIMGDYALRVRDRDANLFEHIMYGVLYVPEEQYTLIGTLHINLHEIGVVMDYPYLSCVTLDCHIVSPLQVQRGLFVLPLEPGCPRVKAPLTILNTAKHAINQPNFLRTHLFMGYANPQTCVRASTSARDATQVFLDPVKKFSCHICAEANAKVLPNCQFLIQRLVESFKVFILTQL